MKVRLTPVQKIAYCGLLIVLNVLLTRIPGLAQVGPIFSFNRIGLGTAVTIFSSLLLGPFYGALVGVAGDALGWVTMGQFTGVFNFFLSIYYAILGIVPWVFAWVLSLFKKRPIMEKSVLYALFFALYALFVSLLWGANLFDESFNKWGMELLSTKITTTVLAFILMALTFVGLFFCLRYFERRSERLSGVPTPYRIGIICFLTEVVVILLKPLAFVLYCLVLVGKPISEAWNITYEGLVLLNLLFGFADIPLNTLSVTLACILSKRFVRSKLAAEDNKGE